jgi:D-alanyl-D-alanine carboxypeptidase
MKSVRMSTMTAEDRNRFLRNTIVHYHNHTKLLCRVLKTGHKQDATMNLVSCVKFGNHSAVVCIFVLSMVQPAVFTKSPALMCKVQTSCKAV